MKKGDLVKVYRKPETQEEFEGWAHLVEKVSDGEGYEVWEVYFSGQRITFYPNRTYARRLIKFFGNSRQDKE